MAATASIFRWLFAGLMALSVAGQPTFAIPRVECVPASPCDEAAVPVPVVVAKACCPSSEHATPAVIPSKLPTHCCVVRPGVPADWSGGRATVAVRPPVLDSLAFVPADLLAALRPQRPTASPPAEDSSPLPQRCLPDQGVGPRAPPVI